MFLIIWLSQHRRASKLAHVAQRYAAWARPVWEGVEQHEGLRLRSPRLWRAARAPENRQRAALSAAKEILQARGRGANLCGAPRSLGGVGSPGLRRGRVQ